MVRNWIKGEHFLQNNRKLALKTVPRGSISALKQQTCIHCIQCEQRYLFLFHIAEVEELNHTTGRRKLRDEEQEALTFHTVIVAEWRLR